MKAKVPPKGGTTNTQRLSRNRQRSKLGRRMSKQKIPLDRHEWTRIARSTEFQKLLASKRRFIVPATIFFIIYYFTLPVLVGYAPSLMSRKVIGPVNIAYIFALSQFLVAWIIAFLYVRAAGKHDRMIKEILDRVETKHDETIEPVKAGGR